MVRPSRLAFFQHVPGGAAPAFNRRSVALAGPHYRLLAASSQPFEQASPMRGMVCHAELRPDQRGHTRLGPDLALEAECFCAALQQLQQVGHLGSGQARERPFFPAGGVTPQGHFPGRVSATG
jgi:hypothetical protein